MIMIGCTAYSVFMDHLHVPVQRAVRGMPMIDFHSHILPGIDDGSKDVSESLLLLTRLQEQGITTVVATPHFYANEQSVEKFLQRRGAAYASLADKREPAMPQLRLGAEVLYYNGISRLQGLDSLCIEGTRLLLLELPFTRWSSTVLQEVLEITNTMGMTVVLAHVERYMRFQRPGVLDELLRNGVIMQVNASYFAERVTRRRALRLLAEGAIHLIGSDCHGVRNRPPRMDEAIAAIRKKYGEAMIADLSNYAHNLLAT